MFPITLTINDSIKVYYKRNTLHSIVTYL